MKPGPSGDSAEIRELKGHPKKKILRNQEGIPVSTRETPPKRLSPPARAFWKKTAPVLMRFGLLTVLDESAFDILCTLYGQWLDTVILLDKQGLATIDERKLPRKNPIVSVYKGLTSELAIWLRMFGLTPDSRQRLTGIIEDMDLKSYKAQKSKFGLYIDGDGNFENNKLERMFYEVENKDEDENPFERHLGKDLLNQDEDRDK